MTLVFDSETTGKADFKALPSAEHQPHLLQLAAVVLDDTLAVRARFSAIVEPDGYEIPAEASAIHGITTEIAKACGFPLRDILQQFFVFQQRCFTRVAHNLRFDDLIVASAFSRIDDEWDRSQMLGRCTMLEMTEICDIPGPYGPKWPKLAEAYKYATSRDLEGAHDAMADVMACVEIYRWLETHKTVSNEKKSE